MYYKPILPDGRPVPLPWQIKTFFFNITWPLKDNPTMWMKIVNNLMVSTAFLIFFLVDEGEILYVVKHSNDINLSVEALVTCVVLNESFLRIFNMAFKKTSFKAFLKEFYAKIYIDETEHPKMWRKIRRGLIPTTVYTYAYILTLTSFLIAPFLKLHRHEKSLPYKMVLHYEYQDPFVYGLTMLYLCWIGSNIIFFFIGEAFLLASCILHLNERYSELQEEIQKFTPEMMSKISNSKLTLTFRRHLVRMFIKGCNLNRFAALLNETYNFRVFVMIAFSAALLCVLIFQAATLGASTQNIAYASWIIAKVSELIIFGTLGSTLMQTTDRTSLSYYNSNWEEIIYRSTKRRANIQMLNDLHIIITLNRNPIRLKGYNFFYVSLDTVIKVLRGAFSYFTCLYTVKQTTGP